MDANILALVCFWLSIIITCVWLLFLLVPLNDDNTKNRIGKTEREIKRLEYRINKANACSFLAMLILSVSSAVIYMSNIKKDFLNSLIEMILVLLIFAGTFICLIIRQILKKNSDSNNIRKFYKCAIVFISVFVLVLDILTYILSRPF